MAERFPRLIAPCLDAEDSRALAGFWSDFLGLAYRPGQGPDDDPGFIVLDGPDGAPRLAVQQVASLPRATWPSGDVPAQAHLDLVVADRVDQADQVQRALALGATLLDDRSDDDGDPLVVMADPAGHPFCLIAPPVGG
ncbi:MAG: VOC family protein [Actinomycetota bacterium]